MALFYFTVPVLETGLFIMFHSLNAKPAGWQTFVVLMNNTIDTDPKYDVPQSNLALVLYETSYVQKIWTGI